MQKDSLRSYLILHLVVFIWGFTAVLGNLITLEALPLVWYRLVIAVLALLVFFIGTKKNMKIGKKELVKFGLAGFVIALHWLAFFWAIKVSNISVTLACLSTGAFFASIMEPIFYKRKVIPYEVLFGFVVVVAIGIIFSVESEYVEGIVLALLAAFLSALFSIINGKLATEYEAPLITFYELTGGVVLLSVFLLLSGGFSSEFFQISSSDWMWLLILGVFCTAYAFLASVRVMKHLTPYTVMLTINLEPIYGILLAVILFKDSEKMTPAFYVGAVLILLTVVLNGIVKYRKKRKLVGQ